MTEPRGKIRVTAHGKRGDTMVEIRLFEWHSVRGEWSRVGAMFVSPREWVNVWRPVYQSHPDHLIDESRATRAIYGGASLAHNAPDRSRAHCVLGGVSG